MNNLPFKGLLLVCDMDGTLLNSRNEVSSENSAALKHFVQGGGMFTIASGRTAKIIREYLDVLPVNTPAIVINGAQIFDFKSRNILYRWSLEKEAKVTIENLWKQYPEMGMEIFSDKGVYIVRENEYTQEHRTRECMLSGVFSLADVPKPWYKVVLAWDNDKLIKVEAALNCNLGSMTQTVFSEKNLFDLLHTNASKGVALKVLCDILQVSCSDVIAIGDNLNDLDMIKVAGTGIAVENAHQELKKHASHCTVHHDFHAVAEVVNWIEKNIGGRRGNAS